MLDFNKESFFIFAHPDDESFYAGGIIQMIAKNKKATIISLTKGEKAKSILTEKDLAKKRTLEFNQACQVLGVQNYHCLDFGDGKIEQNKDTVKEKLEKILDKNKEANIFTFAKEHNYLHKDHIATQKIVTEICNNKNYNLFYIGVPTNESSLLRRSRINNHEHYSIESDYLEEEIFEICFLEKNIFNKKILALKQHQSQNPGSLIEYLKKQEHIEKIFKPKIKLYLI